MVFGQVPLVFIFWSLNRFVSEMIANKNSKPNFDYDAMPLAFWTFIRKNKLLFLFQDKNFLSKKVCLKSKRIRFSLLKPI